MSCQSTVILLDDIEITKIFSLLEVIMVNEEELLVLTIRALMLSVNNYSYAQEMALLSMILACLFSLLEMVVVEVQE